MIQFRACAVALCLIVVVASAVVAAPPRGPDWPRQFGDRTWRDVRQRTVVIDPGHPSEVHAGSTVQHGLTEVEINWEVAQRLARLLERREGVKVKLTKLAVDQMVTNRERAEIANRANAEVMVRLHCDTGSGSGFTVYYPDRQGTVQGVTGPKESVLIGSAAAARAIHAGMKRGLAGRLRDNGMRSDSQTAVGRKQGALTGSIFSEVPTVCIEMVFLSNREDATFIGTPTGQQAVAAAIADGVLNYIGIPAR